MPKRSTSARQSTDRIQISLVNEQARHPVDEGELVAAARAVLRDSGCTSAAVSIAVVDDATIHDLNRRYLDHDWPTDVLSFVLGENNGHLEGEVIISAETAAAAAKEFGWSAAAEQALYVVHGTLHLVGFRDKTPEEAQAMRDAEAKYLRPLGFEKPSGFDFTGTMSHTRAEKAVQRGATAS